jgi:hypothetical protein
MFCRFVNQLVDAHVHLSIEQRFAYIYIYILKPNIKVIIIVIAKVGGIENPFSLHHIYCLFSI